MNVTQKKPLIVCLVIIIILGGSLIALILVTKPTPVALIQNYGLGYLWEEAKIMNECSECHSAVDFHDCKDCHDEHGSAKLAGVRFYEVVELTGDVPEHAFVRVNEIIPHQENVGSHILLFDFLAQNGITSFESITFITNDGGVTTIEYQYLDDTAMLVPYVDGVRFVTESVHVSTWLKGIKQMIVVSPERPITIDGENTSIGRLLLGETIRLTVEGSNPMLTDEDGITRVAYVANWIEGAPLLPLLNTPNPNHITVTDRDGNQFVLDGDEIQNAVIAVVRREVTLVLPDRGRSAWPTGIVQIESK